MGAGGLVEHIYFFAYGILPYLTIAAFSLGLLYKLAYWLSGPAARGPPAPSPSLPQAGSRIIAALILDLALFRRTYRADFRRWCLVLSMHICGAAVIVGHLYFLTEPLYEVPTEPLMSTAQAYVRQLTPVEIQPSVCKLVCFAIGLALAATLTSLLTSRVVNPVRRASSSFINYYNLALLNFTVYSGLAMSADSLFLHALPLETKAVLSALHGIAAQLFIASLPFTCLHVALGAVVTKVAYELRRLTRSEGAA
ncbi:MAG: hypothetical protein QXT74_01955 [Candidatus Nezhaarchaeales archaeon]